MAYLDDPKCLYRQVGQTLEEQSDHGVHCFLFHLHPLEVSHQDLISSFEFWSVSWKVSGCQKSQVLYPIVFAPLSSVHLYVILFSASCHLNQ